MHSTVSAAQSKYSQFVSLLRDLVECETPSGDASAIERIVGLLESRLAGWATLRKSDGGIYGPHTLWNFAARSGNPSRGNILVLGHLDTVHPAGTLAGMPFQAGAERITGPGVLDMKAGIAMFLMAMEILREQNRWSQTDVLLQLNSDEEIGSPSSRPLTEEQARGAVAVLVLEPGIGLEGSAKTARKGVGRYRVCVQGQSAHAGVDFAAGANAIVELSRHVQTIASWTNHETGTTVNPGVIRGGSVSNVVPDSAELDVDVRIQNLQEAQRIDLEFRALISADRRCTLTVNGGINRPPMVRTEATAELWIKARAIARNLGAELDEGSTGGGSDGNFTSAIAPTLDGLGAVGEGAHSPSESILVNRVPDRIALLVELVSSL